MNKNIRLTLSIAFIITVNNGLAMNKKIEEIKNSQENTLQGQIFRMLEKKEKKPNLETKIAKDIKSLIEKEKNLKNYPLDLQVKLFYLAIANHNTSKFIKSLLKKGASVNPERKIYNQSSLNVQKKLELIAKEILHIAIDENDSNFLKIALEDNVNPNLANDFRNKPEPIVRAIEMENFKILQLLIKYKAKLNVLVKGGLYPLDYAYKTKNQQILNYLKENGATKYSDMKI